MLLRLCLQVILPLFIVILSLFALCNSCPPPSLFWSLHFSFVHLLSSIYCKLISALISLFFLVIISCLPLDPLFFVSPLLSVHTPSFFDHSPDISPSAPLHPFSH